MAEEMKDFAEAFGLDYSDGLEEQEQVDDQDSIEQETEVEDLDSDESNNDENEESEGEEQSEEEPGVEQEPQESRAASQSNYKFAQLRMRNKELTNVLKQVGEILGLDVNTNNNDAIVDGVKQAVLQQQAKNQGIPVETLQKITQLEHLVEENERIKLEKNTSESFTELIDEFNLSGEQLNEFTNYLIQNDMNPLEGKQVDIKGEYLKLHWSDMLQAAKDEAVASEQSRREKATNHSGSGVPDKKGDVSKQGDYQISSVAELNDFLGKQNL